MTTGWKRIKNFILLLALFLFAEYVRVIVYHPLSIAADNLIMCSIGIIWAVDLKRRIVDDRRRKFAMGIAISLVVLFAVRACKYAIFDKSSLLWYAYYVPLSTIPLLAFLMSRDTSGQEKHASDKILLAGLVGICLMMLTNDLHQFVYRFHTPGNLNEYSYGIGFAVTIVWIVSFSLATIVNMYRQCSLPQSRNKVWVLMIPTAVGAVMLILSALKRVPVTHGTSIYQFHDVILLMVISLIETCIQIGILPSNDGYEEIFANSGVNACITDQENRVVYSSDSEEVIREEKRNESHDRRVMIDENTRLHRTRINGGAFYYTEDIGEIVRLNHMLEEAAEVISEENEMIEAENQLLRDETMYRTKNKLYDDIARIVRPQVEMIENCLEQCEREPETLTASLAKAAFLNAYIKRRINLSLLAMESDSLLLAELYLSMAESLNYLKYSGVTTSIRNGVKEGRIEEKLCIGIYDRFQKLLENYYGKLSAVMVTIDERPENSVIRITLESEEGSKLLPELSGEYEVYEDEETVVITIRF